jgi:hypothetical protein
MKLLNKIGSLGLLGAIPALSFAILNLGISPANAIPYKGNSVYKTSTDSGMAVYFSATAGSTVSINLGLVSKFSSKIVGSCGEVRVTGSSIGSTPTITVDGTVVTVSSLPIQTLPACSNGTFAEARTSNFKTSTGDVVVVGKTASSAIAIDIPKPTSKSVKINGCGFGVLKNSSSFAIPTSFVVNGTSFNLASLNSAVNPPYCRTVNGTSYGYIPAEWNSP